jgi:hypothetical protein
MRPAPYRPDLGQIVDVFPLENASLQDPQIALLLLLRDPSRMCDDQRHSVHCFVIEFRRGVFGRR